MRGTQHSPGTAPADELGALLLMASSGCVASFERFYRQTCGRVFAVIIRINKDRCEADELLQVTYVKVLVRGKEFDANRGRVIHWLAGVARHSAIDSLRRKQARPSADWYGPHAGGDPFADFCSPDPAPLESLILRQEVAAVRVLLDALPTEQRQCLALVYCGGLSHQEVAQHLGRPLGTVKSWVRRALISMKASLDAAH